MIFTIAGRELQRLFHSPLAWAVLAVVQTIAAWQFLHQIDLFVQLQPKLGGIQGAPGVTDLIVAPLLGNLSLVIVLVIPTLSMRLFSEEFRTGTFTLLTSAPVSLTQITLGKYLGLVVFLGLMLLLITLMPLSLLVGTSLDMSKLGAGVLGISLVTAALAAIGLFISALTRQPGLAAIISYGVLLFLWIADASTGSDSRGPGLFGWLSITYHYQFLLRGVVRSTDLIYFLLLIGLPLILTVHRLESRRLAP